jgi:hypothetical protein
METRYMNQLSVIHAPVPTFGEMERLAEAIANSNMFGIKTKEQALVLMSIAQAEGRHPAIAARDYDIVQNRPAKKAEAMMRDFMSGGGKIEWHALDDTIADATFSHPHGGKVRITWDMKRATTAGIGGKDMWKKFPRQMLRSRTVSEGVRTVWPMATSGMYVPEESQDMPEREPFRGPTLDHEPAPAAPSPAPVPPESKPAATPAPNGNGIDPDTRRWLDNLRQKLATTDRDTVVKIGGMKSVSDALAHAPEAVRGEINDMLADAYAACDKAEADAAEAAEAGRWAGGDLVENDPEHDTGPPTDKERDSARLILAEIEIARDPVAVTRITGRMTTSVLFDRWQGIGRADLIDLVRTTAEGKTQELRLATG